MNLVLEYSLGHNRNSKDQHPKKIENQLTSGSKKCLNEQIFMLNRWCIILIVVVLKTATQLTIMYDVLGTEAKVSSCLVSR